MTARIPILPRGTRLHHDKVRGVMVLLAPERALMLDDIGSAILHEVDGVSSIAAIAARLATRYDAPLSEVASDTEGLLDGLAAQRVVDYLD